MTCRDIVRLTGEGVDEYVGPFLGDGVGDLIHRGEHRGNLRAAILGHDGQLLRVVAEADVVVLLQHSTEVRRERNWQGLARTVTEMKVDQGCAVRTLLVWSIKKSIRLW